MTLFGIDSEFYGDPRRCKVHPWIRTSDPLGMHDAPCGLCEYEIERDHDAGPPPAPPPVDPELDPDLPF